MKIRLLGAFLALGGSIMAGLIYSFCLSSRIATLRKMCEALDLMYIQLETRGEKLPRLMLFLSERCNGEVESFFSSLYKRLDRLGKEQFQYIWAETAEETLCRLGTDELTEIKHLGEMLGRTELETQLGAIQGTLVFLRSNLEMLRQEYPQKKKLGLCLCSAVGLLLIIVLI